MLIKKSTCHRNPHIMRFQRAQFIETVVSHEWSAHLPSGGSVAFSGSVDEALTIALNTNKVITR